MPLNRRALGVALGLGSGFATLLAGAPANQGLALQVSSETAPAGGWAQIKVYAAAPHLEAGGSIAGDVDAAVFGDIANVAVFSATGDALGYDRSQSGGSRRVCDMKVEAAAFLF